MHIKAIAACMALMVALPMTAQDLRDDIQSGKHWSGANYLAYPAPKDAKQTQAPKGYKPFYISTYMRHGSRYHLSDRDYTLAIAPLAKADSAGVLSDKGREAMRKIERIHDMSRGRLGELTPLGARQHRGIAERMFRNYPEIFGGATAVDARSTDVVRCILSMTAECLQLKGMNPKLRFTNDASRHDMYYMNYDDRYLSALRYADRQKVINDYKRRHVHPGRLMKVLFTDDAYVAKNVKAFDLMQQLFFVAMNMQSHDDAQLDIYDLFTADECYDLWSCWNVLWYMEAGDTPLTDRLMPYKEANLLRNIIDTADSCIAMKEPQATLRFGHESCLLPLAVLMGLGDCGYVTDDMETLADHWQCSRYFPMASNIQLVFYRKPGSNDVLVRVMLNEHDTTLPVATDCAPYYHWADVARHYREKLLLYTPGSKK